MLDCSEPASSQALVAPSSRSVSLPISIFSGASITRVDGAVAAVQRAVDEGFGGIWFPQTPSIDTLTALAVAAHRVGGISVGTAVVPIQGRHPFPLAQQALTVADAAGPGRFTLGIGVAHPINSEAWYGVPYRDVVSVCREELEALNGFLSADRSADLVGTHLRTRAAIAMDTDRPGLVVAALGPRMLGLAGSLADGTVTWMTGPRALRERVVPVISQAADKAGRPAPRVVVGVSVCITKTRAEARDRIRPMIEKVAAMPSYRRMMAAEGVDDPIDTALIGGLDEVLAGLAERAAAGATEVLADPIGTLEEQSRTRSILARWGLGGDG